MIKTTLIAALTISILLTGTIAAPVVLLPLAEAAKGQGVANNKYGSATDVCGDRLCSEIPGGKEAWKSQERGSELASGEEKKTVKTKDTPKKENISEKTKQEIKTPPTPKAKKIISGSKTSVQDPGIGHETHQLAVILPPSDKIYNGHLTYAASENIQLVALHGPLAEGKDKGQATWSPDGETIFGLTFVDPKKAAGTWEFSGNALAVHTMNETPFTATYTVTYTENKVDDKKILRGTITSVQDPGIGHETHQLAVILPPRDKPYSGHLTYDASESIQLVSLIGPLQPKHAQGQPTWSPDGQTHFALVFVDPKKAAGSWEFSGNALAVHTMNETPFTVSYSVVLTQ